MIWSFVMNEVVKDIERLESILLALEEGASDEKRMAISLLESMLSEKRILVELFEMEYANG